MLLFLNTGAIFPEGIWFDRLIYTTWHAGVYVPSILYYILVSEMLCHQKLFPHFVNMFVLLAKFDYRNRDRVFMFLIKLMLVLFMVSKVWLHLICNLRAILYVDESKCFFLYFSLFASMYIICQIVFYLEMLSALYSYNRGISLRSLSTVVQPQKAPPIWNAKEIIYLSRVTTILKIENWKINISFFA